MQYFPETRIQIPFQVKLTSDSSFPHEITLMYQISAISIDFTKFDFDLPENSHC